MSEMTPEEYEEFKAKWDDRLSGEYPMMTHRFDVPVKVSALVGGDLAIDCPCFQLAGFDRLGIVRLQLSPVAARIILRGLQEIEKILDLPDEGNPLHGPQ
jgi:hypothetical protein